MLLAELIVTSQQEGRPGAESEPFQVSLGYRWATGLGVSGPQRGQTQATAVPSWVCVADSERFLSN